MLGINYLHPLHFYFEIELLFLNTPYSGLELGFWGKPNSGLQFKVSSINLMDNFYYCPNLRTLNKSMFGLYNLLNIEYGYDR